MALFFIVWCEIASTGKKVDCTGKNSAVAKQDNIKFALVILNELRQIVRLVD